MKKNVVLVAALFALVVGGVFAQKVGDNVQLSGQDYRVEEVRDNRVVLQKVASLEGAWDKTSGGNNITVITFSGNKAVITEFVRNQSNDPWKNAQDKRLIKIGDPYIRNIQNTNATTWSCEVLELNSNSNYSDIVWYSGTITLQANGDIAVGLTGSPSWRVDFRKKQDNNRRDNRR